MTQGTALFGCFRHFVTATEGELACLPYTRIFPTPSLYQSCSAGLWSLRSPTPSTASPPQSRHSPLCCCNSLPAHILASRLSLASSHLSSEVLQFLHKVPTGLDLFLVSHNLIPTSRLISCVRTGSSGRRALSWLTTRCCYLAFPSHRLTWASMSHSRGVSSSTV